jgi:hypothetical protein
MSSGVGDQFPNLDGDEEELARMRDWLVSARELTDRHRKDTTGSPRQRAPDARRS